MLLTIVPELPYGEGTNVAVFAVGDTEELFLGHTASVLTGKLLLAEMVPLMQSDRLSLYQTLAGSGPIRIERRKIARGDKYHDLEISSGYVDVTGSPFLALS